MADAVEIDALWRDAVDRSRREPVDFFARQFLGIDTIRDEWQIETMEALADVWRKTQGIQTRFNHDGLKRITIRSGHGPGKTWIAAMCAHWFGFCFKCLIPVTAPKFDQVKTRFFPRFRSILSTAKAHNPVYGRLIDVQTSQAIWADDPDWLIVAQTASEPENLAGLHEPYLLFVVDESSGVNELMYPAIEGALSTGVVCVELLISNPTRTSGTFYQSHMVKRVADQFYQIHADPRRSSFVSKEWIASMIARYGESSSITKVRVYGEFAEMVVGQLLDMEWLCQAIDRWSEVERMEAAENAPWRLSLDVADGGEDATVLTVARRFSAGMAIHKQSAHRFEKSKATIQGAELIEAAWHALSLSADRGDDIVVDGLGVGAGTCGELIRKGYPVIVYKGGEGSDDPKKWRNRRTQSYIALRNDARDGALFINPDIVEEPEDYDEFMGHLTCIKTKDSESSDRVEDLVTKREMKAAGLSSPDRADSIAMLYATSTPDYYGREAPDQDFVIHDLGGELVALPTW